MPATSTLYWFAGAAALLALVAVLGVLALAPARRRERALRKALRAVGHDTLTGIVIPDGVDGEIQIDHLLLTPRGFLVLEIKRVDGTVFGGEQLEQWTALSKDRRVAFANPLVLLRRRMVALQTYFDRGVPVDGRVVLVGDVTLGADLPAIVTTPEGLREAYSPAARSADRAALAAFEPHWDALRRSAAA